MADYTESAEQQNVSFGTKHQIPYLIIVSAENDDILHMQIERLLKACKDRKWKEESIKDVAYTLQVGREAMIERLGLIAYSMQDLIRKLELILKRGVDHEEDYIKRGRKTESVNEVQYKEQEAADILCKGDYDTLLQVWASGATVPWEQFYQDNAQKPKRVALPTYPFAYAQNRKKNFSNKCANTHISNVCTTLESGIRSKEPIAIVGVSARFPMAENISEFWENLKTERNCITEIPKKRWNMDLYFEENKEKAYANGKSYCKWGGFLEGMEEFDPLFFQIPPAEAERMDPQERLFLEECWKAVEDAGYVPSKLKPEQRRKTGVYGAITKTGFMLWNMKTNHCYNTSFSSFVNRVSYFMDFGGPSKVVDTMCSSSLTALHEACQALHQGEIDMAVAGGANLYLHPHNFQLLSQARMIADSKESSVFEKGGLGFTPSEGVGAVVLKRLSDAERDHDAVWAVIKGSAVMHSGRTNGYNVPAPGKIAEVMEAAIADAQIEPETIRHMEAAANGSELTDAMEMAAVTKLFGKRHNQQNGYYTISSVKQALGHGEAVSGLAQLIKAILQLKHQMLCPMTMPKDVNPNIDFENLPFEVNTRLSNWTQSNDKGESIPRRIGINSLGAGGVYAHMILEEYINENQIDMVKQDSKPMLFLFSAKTTDSLDMYLVEWKHYLLDHPELDMWQLSYILQNKREGMKKRFASIAQNRQELLENIEDYQNQKENSNNYCGDWNHHEGKQVSQEEINQMLREEKLVQLARIWTSNLVQIPWEQMYGEDRPYQIPDLPKYPFKKRVFWVDTTEEDTETDSEAFVSLADILEEETVGESTKREIQVTATEMEQLIRRLLQEILYLDEQDELDDTENFMEIGLDSIYTSEFIKKFNKETGLNLKETVMFNYPNIKVLASYAATEINTRG